VLPPAVPAAPPVPAEPPLPPLPPAWASWNDAVALVSFMTVCCGQAWAAITLPVKTAVVSANFASKCLIAFPFRAITCWKNGMRAPKVPRICIEHLQKPKTRAEAWRIESHWNREHCYAPVESFAQYR
jgi:hypothetical protein